MADVNKLARSWERLINIADHQMRDSIFSGLVVRRGFYKLVEESRGSTLTATELLNMMEVVTEKMINEDESEVYSGQLMILSLFLGTYFPATEGLAAIAYECSIKSFSAGRAFCPN